MKERMNHGYPNTEMESDTSLENPALQFYCLLIKSFEDLVFRTAFTY